MKLKDKVILVTGGSGLLGKAIIEDINQNQGIAINLDISAVGDDEYKCDITNQQEVSEKLRIISEKYNHIDGLVNNAYPRTDDWGNNFEDESYASIQQNIEMQLASVVYLCQQVGKQMKRESSIVNISSIYGVVGNDPNLYEGTKINAPATYSAIKGGIVNFTRYLAARWGSKGIRVNCVSPGGIFNNQEPKFVIRYEKRVPLKKMGKPEDIAPAVSFLLSDDAGYITGHNLVIDGGWTCI